jgi:S-adenosylmethionine/arginine decarboxylase-like enzyme
MIKLASPDASDQDIITEYNDNKYWGMESLVNIYACDRELIKDPKHIRDFIENLCKLINMERYGDPMIERFGSGHLYGYSAVQLIHTSCITIHFAEESGDVYLDVFSCKSFSSSVVAKFALEFFKGNGVEIQTLFRD